MNVACFSIIFGLSSAVPPTSLLQSSNNFPAEVVAVNQPSWLKIALSGHPLYDFFFQPFSDFFL